MSHAYLRPQELSEAVALLSNHADANALAGGQSLLASMKLGLIQPSHLIDLQDIQELHAIELTKEGLWIGAMVTHAQVAHSKVVQSFSPMLSQLAGGERDGVVSDFCVMAATARRHNTAAK